MDEAVLRVEDLGKRFILHERGARLQALAGLSFSLRAGSIAALTGPSGAGKSTVLKCLWRTYLPSAGRLLYRDADGATVDLAACDEHRIIGLRTRELGFVTQFLHCLPRKSALEVVAEPARRAGLGEEAARERAAGLLARLRIPEALWHLPPATFSGGERQRVNIARGLCRPSRLLLLDEPTASLDREAASRVADLIAEARDGGAAVLAIWHDPVQVERLADQRITIVHEPCPEACACA